MRFLALAMALLVLQATPGAAAELTGTLKRISERGQINIGFREFEPPMSFVEKSGKPVGYSIDLCEHITAAIKRKIGKADITVNYVPVTAETRFSSIENGKVDILCGATTKTLSRAERVGFTQLTFVTGASLLSMNQTPVSGLMGLKGRKVAVVSNTTTIDALKGAVDQLLIDAQVVPVATADKGMEMLEKGQVDAFSSDQVVLIGQVIARDTGMDYFLSNETFSYEPFALAIPRGDADFQLIANRALSQLNRSGQITAIYSKWFGRFTKQPPPALQSLYRLNSIPE